MAGSQQMNIRLFQRSIGQFTQKNWARFVVAEDSKFAIEALLRDTQYFYIADSGVQLNIFI